MHTAQVFSDRGCFNLQMSGKNDENGGKNKSALHSYMLTWLNHHSAVVTYGLKPFCV